MKNLKTIELTEIKSIIPSNGRINTIFYTGTIDDAIKNFEWLKERKIISVEIKTIELSKDEYINEEGLLSIMDFDAPVDTETEKDLNDFRRKTTGESVFIGGKWYFEKGN